MASTEPTQSSRSTRARRSKQDKSVTAVVSELWELTVAYAKQEIKDPLVGLGSYIAWGIASMLLLGIGSVLLVIGGLRALQTETGSTFTGNLSWAPYGIVLAVSLIVLGIVGSIITRDRTVKQERGK